MKKEMKLPVRIAVRDEGDLVKVYLAAENTLKDAKLIATVDKGAALLPGIREKIIDLGQSIVGELIKEVLKGDVEPVFVREPVPEHEKAGHS